MGQGLSGRVALVTGSSRGIGRGIALAMAEAGSDVVINYRARQDEALAVESEIRQIGRRCQCVQADVSRKADVDRLVREAEKEFGAIDILVNNAGIAHADDRAGH